MEAVPRLSTGGAVAHWENSAVNLNKWAQINFSKPRISPSAEYPSLSVVLIFILILRRLYSIRVFTFDRALLSFFQFNTRMIFQLAIFKPAEKKRIWDGELAVPSVGGQFSGSAFTLDYKGGVCSPDAQTSLEGASVPGQHTDLGRQDELAPWLWRAVRNA